MKPFLPTLLGSLILTGAAHAAQPVSSTVPTVTYNGTAYELDFHAKNPESKIEIWEYTPAGENVDNWSRMATIHHYENNITAAELAGRMAALGQKQKGLVMYNGKSGSLCFHVHDDKVFEANAWKFATGPDGKTWGNGLQWRFPVKDTQTIDAAMAADGAFGKACQAMPEWKMQYPHLD